MKARGPERPVNAAQGGAAKARIPDARERTVLRLRIHPVKGARGSDVDEMEFDDIGPRFDRRWMVVDADGVFISQRGTPELATVRAKVAGGALVLAAPGAGEVAAPVVPEGPRISARVWDSQLDVRTASAEADAWLTALLGAPHRLVHIGADDERQTDPAYAAGHRVGFADGYPALLVTDGSVEELGRRVGRPIPVERFRPNIVVAGGQPHEEDQWRRFAIGRLAFGGVKLCSRCKVTTIDQESGRRDRDREPLRTLARYRHLKDKVYFGVNVVHHANGRIRVGDPVTVDERAFIPGA